MVRLLLKKLPIAPLFWFCISWPDPLPNEFIDEKNHNYSTQKKDNRGKKCCVAGYVLHFYRIVDCVCVSSVTAKYHFVGVLRYQCQYKQSGQDNGV